MNENILLEYVQKLADYIISQEFEPITQRTPYYHMGATIVDATLQAGLNYRYVVYPRILKLLTEFSDYKTTCDFIILMQTIPLPELIDWNNNRKLKVIHDMSWLFYNNGIENEDMLAKWLDKDENIYKLKNINGVGPKTIDYLKMLSGKQSIAIDRHLFTFLNMAGIVVNSYQEASILYNNVAEFLHISKYELDRQIWLTMSKP